MTNKPEIIRYVQRTVIGGEAVDVEVMIDKYTLARRLAQAAILHGRSHRSVCFGTVKARIMTLP
jgi:hypothetical protein